MPAPRKKKPPSGAIVAGVKVVLLLAQELNTDFEGVPVLEPGEVISIEEGVEGVVGAGVLVAEVGVFGAVGSGEALGAG